MSFKLYPLAQVTLGLLGLAGPVCLGGNQELVGQKTTELHAINEQVAKQAAPKGLKEGDTVEVKASLRVDRSSEKGPVVRDAAIESVKVSGKLREPGVAEKRQVAGSSEVRQARLPVPATGGPPERKNLPAEGTGTNQAPADAGEKLPMKGTPGFRQERLNVPSVNEKGKD